MAWKASTTYVFVDLLQARFADSCIHWVLPEINKQAFSAFVLDRLPEVQGNNICSLNLQLSPRTTGCNLTASVSAGNAPHGCEGGRS